MGRCTSDGTRSVRMGMGKTTVSAGNVISGCMAATMSDAGACAWTESTVARDLLPLLDLGWELLLGWELPLALLWRDPCPRPFLLSYLRLSYLRSSSRSRLRSQLEERPRSARRSCALRSFRSRSSLSRSCSVRRSRAGRSSSDSLL